MARKESTSESQRSEFVAYATAVGANRSALCRRFGISSKTAYKWLHRDDGAVR